MILWPQPDGTVFATPQPAHALIAGQLMRAFAAPPRPFEPVCTAAAQHDCAWMPVDADPPFDAGTGLPRAFNAFSGADHVPMWEAGVRLALANWGLWVGLLVLRHGAHIYRIGMLADRMRPGAESAAAMEGYLAREPAWSAAIMARLGVGEAEVAPNAAKLALVDAVALALCWGKERMDCGNALDPSRPLSATLVRTGPFAATLDPWPFAPRALALETETIVLPGRSATAGALREALADAPRRTLRFTLCPA
ncbi:MAG: DUF3891 family protein [Acetobacteraceae bacterium]|nr:DUF3891 family protein [Acetobacteraceae bacterium]MCX7683873.1 DUF3891 family protein [Acetobacteraceae bacterium]